MARRLTPEEIADARAHYQRYLVSHGIKFTQPRRRILDAVLAMDGHFEAEQLLYELRQRGFRVGKATIYRTLPLLVDCGLLKQVRFDVKQAHYEHAFGEDAHDHMVCRRCGRIIEFAADEVVELRKRLASRYQFHPIAHRFQISGLCWQCATACPAAKPLTASASPGRSHES
ncbi:MAG TPA: transcriptional repressor [Phycisphaerae bacterium]|jgi:Fur family ferric uptake transcriptional regulator